jgi:hypothetical protein
MQNPAERGVLFASEKGRHYPNGTVAHCRREIQFGAAQNNRLRGEHPKNWRQL